MSHFSKDWHRTLGRVNDHTGATPSMRDFARPGTEPASGVGHEAPPDYNPDEVRGDYMVQKPIQPERDERLISDVDAERLRRIADNGREVAPGDVLVILADRAARIEQADELQRRIEIRTRIEGELMDAVKELAEQHAADEERIQPDARLLTDEKFEEIKYQRRWDLVEADRAARIERIQQLEARHAADVKRLEELESRLECTKTACIDNATQWQAVCKERDEAKRHHAADQARILALEGMVEEEEGIEARLEHDLALANSQLAEALREKGKLRTAVQATRDMITTKIEHGVTYHTLHTEYYNIILATRDYEWVEMLDAVLHPQPEGFQQASDRVEEPQGGTDG